MRRNRGQCIFKLGVVAIVIMTIFLISNFDQQKWIKRHQESWNADEQIGVHHSKYPEQKTTLGTFEALRGTCFLPTNEGEQYVYNKDKIDRFSDLRKAVLKFNLDASSSEDDVEEKDTIAGLSHWKITAKASNLEKFYMNISRYEMYPENTETVDNLLYDMATLPIMKIEQKDGGTQFKAKMILENGTQVIFKPARAKRDEQTPPNQLYYAELERHTSEIAAFHVDRVLGSRRAMPVVGRNFHMVIDIMRLAYPALQRSFFISPANNLCFFEIFFKQYSDSFHPVCGDKDMLEGSLCAFFPDLSGSYRRSRSHPWKRTYEKDVGSHWETDCDYGEKVKSSPQYNQGTLLMELIDMSIFDFLIGNQDRHNYQRFEVFGENTFTLRYDHGRSFGRAYHDELKILAPLLQCCMIRTSTLEKLLELHNGEKPFSELVRASMSKDPISPILWEPHLEALDRRLSIVLQSIRDCIKRKSTIQVLVAGKTIN